MGLKNLPQDRLPNLTSADYQSPTEWLLSIFILLSITWILSLFLRNYRNKIYYYFNKITFIYNKHALLSATILGTCLLLTIGTVSFHFKPHIIDSIVELFQAKIFAKGKITFPAPENYGFFYVHNILINNGIWASQYPPLHALLLALGTLLGHPWIVIPFFLIGTIYFIYQSIKIIYNQEAASLSVLLLILSPFFLFLSASYKNHSSTLFFISGFFYFINHWLKRSDSRSFFLAALMAGLGANIRPLSILITALPLTCLVVRKIIHNKQYALLFFGITTGVISLAPTFIFNYYTTGDIFKLGYIQNWGEGHKLGFHTSPWGNDFTLRDGLINQYINFIFFNNYCFESLFPALFPVAIFLILKNKFKTEDHILILGFILTPLVYLFYWHTDVFLGPRFFFESLIFFIPLTARVLIIAYQKTKNLSFANLPLQLVFIATICISLGYFISFSFPNRLLTYNIAFPSFKFDLQEKLKEKDINEGIVFVKVSWGSRMISLMRNKLLPQNLVEEAYKSLGHCELYKWLQKNYYNNSQSEQIIELTNLIQDKSRVLRTLPFGNKDTASFRLPINISEECKNEFFYDHLGFTIYIPHFLINSFARNSRLIIAKDLRQFNSLLADKHPDLPVYYLLNDEIYTEKEYLSLLQRE